MNCRQVLQHHPHSWRAGLVLARLHRSRGEMTEARNALTEALMERPGSITLQSELWDLLELDDVSGEDYKKIFDRVIRDARLVDPYVCLRCGFKATEPFPRCPHCHDWNTVAEEQT